MSLWLVLLCSYQLVGSVDWTLEETLPAADNTLKHLLMIGVHGIRTPLYGPFKGDLQAEKYPTGENRLTEEGELQMRHVAKALRTRYYDLIEKRSSSFTRISYAPESPPTNDSVRIFTPAIFPHRIPTTIVEQGSNDLDRTYMVYENPEQTLCPMYVCLRDKYRGQSDKPTRAEKALYKLFTRKTGVKVKSLETFFPIYDRLRMEKLNKDRVPEWFNSIDLITAEGLRAKWKRKLIGDGEKTWKFFTDAMVIAAAGFFKLDEDLFDREIQKMTMIKIINFTTEDVLIYAFGWILFDEAFEKEFNRPFSVEVGDTLLMELHNIEGKEIFKVFYYCPTSENPDLRFKELSLKPFLEKKKEDSDHFLTRHLNYLLNTNGMTVECQRARSPWFSKAPFLRQFNICL